MRSFTGKGVCGGIAIGKASIFKRVEAKVTRIKTDDTAHELERFETARRHAMDELEMLYDKALPEVGEAGAQIFEIHRMMLDDADYTEAIRAIIERQQVNAEYAVALGTDNFEAMFSAMEDSYMKARAADVRDIANRLIGNLSGKSEDTSDHLEGKLIICADDLAPSETVTLDKSRVLAFVTAHGSTNSHTAILARSMNIPAIIGLGDAFLACVKDGDTVIVNGTLGELTLSPDENALNEAKGKLKAEVEARNLLEELRGKDNVTMDGRKIEIYANIGGIDEIGTVLLCDAGGIGLFRSEFLYLESDDFPTEEEQFAVYKRVLESMADKKVIIRTMDIGADKQAHYFGLAKEENPALGMRALRICLTRPDIFRPQLRALYRASVYGRLGIMFPMITSTAEVAEVLEICEKIKGELSAEGIPYSKDVELGIMIETPAAAITSDRLAPMVDFFSVGTNDLTQYTLACDRQNPALDRFCDTRHEAIIRLIEYAARSAHANGKWIGICGELAADLELTERFLDMGIDELSVSPSLVLKLRERVRSIGK